MPKKPARSNTPVQRTITPELIRDALACIPPDLDRTDWARLGMAIKSEYSGDAGFDLWNDWSARGESYNERNARDTWRSIKAGGATTIGTLFGVAKDHGFKFSEGTEPAKSPDPAALLQAQRLAEKKRKQREAEEATYSQRADQAAREAAKLWQEASESGQSPYLVRKRVKGHGVRYLQDGTLLVPMVAVAPPGQGVMQNVQRIAPEKPSDGGTDKRFLSGGRKTGMWHLIGTISEALPLLLAEGYATAASLFEATGHPVGVCWDAGNLVHVTKALRQLYPTKLLLVCGDDDGATEKRTGTNPGRVKATAAARAALTDIGPSGVVFPNGPPDANTDFNDLAPEAVRELVAAALTAPSIPKGQGKAGEKVQVKHKPASDDAEDKNRTRYRDPFTVDDGGVWYTPPGDEGGSPRKVCDSLRVVALARNMHDTHASLMLEFETLFGKTRRWLMPLAMLSGDGTSYRNELFGQAFMCPADMNRRKWLTEYLQSRKPTEMVRHVSRVGWCGRAYVLPTETLIADAEAENVVFCSEAGIDANFSQRGTLEAWKSSLASLCVGNSRLAFATAGAFAGPLLAWAPGTSGGGMHYFGDTSIGKTTGLLIGTSVWGKGSENDPESYMQKWRATGNGLEFQAEQHNDCTMFLDELGQTDPQEAGLIAYMLADGVGKVRGKASGGLRHKPTWRLLFFSSGELTLAQHMETAGKTMRGGQEVRLIPIPAELSPGSTLETLHSFPTGHEFSVAVKQRAATCYGWAGHEWLRWLVKNTEGLAARVRDGIEAFEGSLKLEGAGGQVKRGARRFALIAVAGEMATTAGLTGWPEGEASRAAKVCFDAWIRTRSGGLGASERTQALRQVRYWIEKHGEANLTLWHRIPDAKKANTPMRCGYRRLVDEDGEPVKFDSAQEYSDDRAPPEKTSAAMAVTEYLISVEAFKTDLCKGFDPAFVVRVLKDHDLLIHDADRQTKAYRVPTIGKQSLYHIKANILSIDV